jgi:hypothetical protein
LARIPITGLNGGPPSFGVVDPLKWDAIEKVPLTASTQLSPVFPSCYSGIKDARLPYAAGSAVNESKLPFEFGADTGTSPGHDP